MTDPQRRRPTGRRAGDSGTRDAILEAALALFARHGFEGASIRAIASTAGVDPALIRHFFGDKEALFVTALAARSEIPERLAAAAARSGPSAGHAFADAYLGMWEDPETRPVLLALVRSAVTSPRAGALLRETFIARIVDRFPVGPEDLGPVALAGAHLLGIALARHVIELPLIVAISHEELVEQVAPTIQRYLTGTHR